MKRMFLSALLTLLVVASSAVAGNLTVVPNQFTNVEGNSSSSTLFQTASSSLQVYYSEAFLTAAGITPGMFIDGLAYRRNGGGATGPAGDTFFENYDIFLSESFATPGSFTNTFASNVVGAQTHVRGGPLTLSANSMPGGGTPNDFGPMIDFTTPYIYDGGSLLIEIRRSARTGDTTSFLTDVDNSIASQAGARWLFNLSSDTAATGTISNSAQIFQLRYAPVPGPSSLALFAIVGTATGLTRRRRSIN